MNHFDNRYKLSMRHVGVEPTLQEPESCVRSITLAAQYYIILVEVG